MKQSLFHTCISRSSSSSSKKSVLSSPWFNGWKWKWWKYEWLLIVMKLPEIHLFVSLFSSFALIFYRNSKREIPWDLILQHQKSRCSWEHFLNDEPGKRYEFCKFLLFLRVKNDLLTKYLYQYFGKSWRYDSDKLDFWVSNSRKLNIDGK